MVNKIPGYGWCPPAKSRFSFTLMNQLYVPICMCIIYIYIHTHITYITTSTTISTTLSTINPTVVLCYIGYLNQAIVNSFATAPSWSLPQRASRQIHYLTPAALWKTGDLSIEYGMLQEGIMDRDIDWKIMNEVVSNDSPTKKLKNETWS